MRIVHVIDHYQPWMGYQETYLAREQTRQGHQVTVVTSDRVGTVAGHVAGDRIVTAGREVIDGVDVVRLPVRFELPTRAAYVWLRGLQQTMAGLKPDAVHCHGVLGFTAVRMARLKHQLGFRLIYDSHMATFNVYSAGRSSMKGRLQRLVYPTLGRIESPWVLRQADALVAIGEPERDFVQDIFGKKCPDVLIVRLGADSRHFSFRSDDRVTHRDRFGWSEGDVVLGHAGTIRRSKSIDALIRAAGALTIAGHPVRVFVVGRIDDAHRSELQAEVARLGLEEQVAFQEFVSVDDLPAYLSAMDIAVWPGDISNTAIEAMAVGLPVVAARTAYTESVIERHGAGVLFQQGNDDQLTRVLEPLVSDRQQRQARSQMARDAVERELNWASIARQFTDIYAAVPVTSTTARQVRASS
jgi:glycosyltransferase involved in cell wall biosynthesis